MVLGCRTHRNVAKRGGGNVGGGSSRSRDFGEYWLGFLGAGNGGGEGVYMGKEGSDLIAIFQRILIRNKLGFGGVRVLHGGDEDDRWAPSGSERGREVGCAVGLLGRSFVRARQIAEGLGPASPNTFFFCLNPFPNNLIFKTYQNISEKFIKICFEKLI